MPYIKKREADNIKKQICALYNNGGDWRALAKTLGVKTTTSYRWVNGQNVAEKQRGGNRRSKITNEHRNFIEQCVEQNTRITLKQMKEKLMQTYQIAVSVECVRKHLDGMLFTLKNIRREPENANNEINKRKRRQYVEQLIAYQSENRPIIYGIWMKRTLIFSYQEQREDPEQEAGVVILQQAAVAPMFI